MRDLSNIIEDELFQKFMDKLEENDFPEERKQELRDIAIKSMIEAEI